MSSTLSSCIGPVGRYTPLATDAGVLATIGEGKRQRRLRCLRRQSVARPMHTPHRKHQSRRGLRATASAAEFQANTEVEKPGSKCCRGFQTRRGSTESSATTGKRSLDPRVARWHASRTKHRGVLVSAVEAKSEPQNAKHLMYGGIAIKNVKKDCAQHTHTSCEQPKRPGWSTRQSSRSGACKEEAAEARWVRGWARNATTSVDA